MRTPYYVYGQPELLRIITMDADTFVAWLILSGIFGTAFTLYLEMGAAFGFLTFAGLGLVGILASMLERNRN